MSELIIDRISDYADELLPPMGLELVEVQYRKEQHGWVLRIFIDAKDGVTHDHCSLVSRQMGDYLDVEDIISHAYHLEVSSPGLERKLSKLEDFVRFAGSKAKVRLHNAIDEQKVFVGEITGVDGNNIEIETEEKKKIQFSFEAISRARLTI